MLDFGTEMNSGEPEHEDDLFSVPPVSESDPGKPLPEKTAVPPEEKNTAPVAKRPWIKPPTLPKYTEPAAPVQEKIHPSLKGNTHFLHRKRKSEEFSTEDKMKVSRILKEARTSAGISPDDVEEATQIRAHYLVALENGDYDRLPQPVYVLAYLRKLCELYDISAAEEAELVKPWRDIPYELPDADKLSNSVQRDDDDTDRKAVQRFGISLFSAGALIIIGIVVLIVVLIVSYFSGKDIPETAFRNSRLLDIQPKPQLTVPAQPKVQ